MNAFIILAQGKPTGKPQHFSPVFSGNGGERVN